MSNGELTNILVSTDVTRYIEFRQVAGSYVQQGQGSKATVAKVPSDAGEALKSPLMGLFEKRRARSFLNWVAAFDEANPSTHNGMSHPQEYSKRQESWARVTVVQMCNTPYRLRIWYADYRDAI
ncbi:hypothetical protein KC354_g108 [Hortaea werneckii]|nr:hypothetical protein KC354_g108 [Hortaea werneckii]